MAIKTLSIADFTGGRNSKASSFNLAKNESLDQLNTWTYNGALVKRPGSLSVSTLALDGATEAVIKMVPTNLGTTGANRLVFMAYTTYPLLRLAYTDNGTTFAFCETVPTQFDVAPVRIPFMAMFGAFLYVSDGVSSVVRYNGTTVAAVSAFPKTTRCAVHKNYMFAGSGLTLSWSDVNDPTTWPANNFQTISSDVGDRIIALHSWGGNLIIFCRRSMWLLVGDSFDPVDAQYYLQKITTPSNFNFMAGETIVTHMGILKFLTVDGFYAYAGGNAIVKISDPIQPDLDTAAWAVGTNEYDNSFNSPRSYVWKNNMYCSLRMGSETKIVIQDSNGKWWFWQLGGDLNNTIFNFMAIDLGAGEKLYGGSTAIYSMFLTFDTGSKDTSHVPAAYVAMNGYWISRDLSLPNESRFLYADIFLKKQTAVATLGTLVFSYSIDGATFITANVDMMNGVGTILKKRVPIMRIGRSIRVKVLNAELGVTFEVYQINVVYEQTDAMR